MQMLVMRAPEGLQEIVMMKSQPSPGRFVDSASTRCIFQFNKGSHLPDHPAAIKGYFIDTLRKTLLTMTFMTFMNSTGQLPGHTY